MERPPPDSPPPQAAPSIIPMALAALVSAAIVIGCVRGMFAALPQDVSIQELLADPEAVGRAVRVAGQYDAVALGEAPPERPGEKAAHYVAFGDGSTKEKIVLRLGRPPSPLSDRRTLSIAETIVGTVADLPASRAAALAGVASDQGVALGEDVRLVLVDGDVPPFPAGYLLMAILVTVAGTLGTLTLHRHRQMALESRAVVLPRVQVEPAAVPEPVMPSDTGTSRTREAAYQQATSQAPCGVCGAVVMGFMKLCPNCKVPRQIEYYVSASLPLAGFERLTPVVQKALGETEYQVARSLARPHMPIPFSAIAALRERFHGGQSDTIHRLLAKGHASFMAAQTLKDELERKGTESIIVSSEDLARAPRPVTVTAAASTLDGLELAAEGGLGLSARFDDIFLVIVYGEESTADTLTHRGVRSDSSPSSSGSRRNIADIYTRTLEAAIRVHGDRFDWSVLKERRTGSPEANFGHFVDFIEARSPEAVIHAVTDTHAGAWSEWRSTYYSTWRALVSRRGADKGRGVLAIEGYRILGEVGKGAWGRVFKAVQDRVERVVAIKVLSSQFPRDEKFRERFFREARTAGQLNHPNVVAVIDCNEQRGMHYLVMEFVDGVTLKDLVKTRGPFQELQALRAAKAVGRALEHAHEKGIVHRDIKPENIFLSKDGHVKLGDWGLAKSYTSDDANLTDTGAAMGTPNYISPEQVKAIKEIDHRADIYALGGTLHYLLTGAPPFPAPTVIEIMTRHLKDPPPDPRRLVPGVSAASAAIVEKAMAKLPEDRFATATELITAIDAAAAPLEVGKPATGTGSGAGSASGPAPP